MALLNIKFADGNELVSYNDDSSYYPGCPTCDYGSQYINDIDITTTNYYIEIVFRQSYQYAFSVGKAIQIFATCDYKTITEQGFLEYIKRAFHEIGTPKKFKITERN